MRKTWTEYTHGYRQSDSYWQRGFNDGSTGKHPEPPSLDGAYAPINRGYMNGYRAGIAKFDSELMAAVGVDKS